MEKKKKLEEGDQALFILNNRRLMEKVTIESVDKDGATLSNKVKVSRKPGPDGSYSRIDGKPGLVFLMNEESEKLFQAYKAYFSLKRSLEDFQEFLKNLDDGEETMDRVIELSNKVAKLVNKYIKKC